MSYAFGCAGIRTDDDYYSDDPQYLYSSVSVACMESLDVASSLQELGAEYVVNKYVFYQFCLNE
jgi:hypothetical protein